MTGTRLWSWDVIEDGPWPGVANRHKTIYIFSLLQDPARRNSLA